MKATACVSRIVLVTSLMAACGAVRTEPPTVSFATDGVNGNETVLLCGDGFDRPGLEVQRWLPPQPARDDWNADAQRQSLERALHEGFVLPERPEGRPSKLVLSEITPQTCMARLPSGGYQQVQALYARTADGATAPWLLNRPKLWWAVPEFPAPGTRVRLFGRQLAARYGSGQAAWLRDAQGRLQPLEYGAPRGAQPVYDAGLTTPYELGVALPGDLPPGPYEILVHNGSGGDWGWSAPLAMTVQAPAPGPTTIVKAAQHGALPDDDQGDSEALEKALAAAAEQPAGGIVQLEAGVYHLTRNLRLPPKTILRGAGRGATTIAALHDAPLPEPFAKDNFPDQDAGYYQAVTGVTPLVWLPEQCALEHLALRGAPDTLLVLIGTRNGAGPGIALRDCAAVNRHPVWYRNGQYRFAGNCLLVAGATDGLEICDCFLEGSQPIASMMQLLRRATIAGNTLGSFPPGRSDCAAFRKPLECLFEDNYFLNAKRGLVIQPQGMARHNLVANNRVEHTERGGNAGEVELWEGGTAVTGGRVRSAAASTLEAEDVVWEVADRSGRTSDLREKAVGYVCLITRGRGLGQYRFVQKIEGDRIALDRPWGVVPGPGAEFMITTAMIENLVLNNTDRDGDAGMQFWGGCIANVISGHISDDTEGIILHAADQRLHAKSNRVVGPRLAGVQKCWFNDLRLCRFERGARLQLWPMRNPDADLDDAGPLVLGNTVRECAWGDAPRLPHQNQWYAFWEQKRFHPDPDAPLENHIAIRLAVKGALAGDPDDVQWDALAPPATANILERNFVDRGWPVGIYETRSARGNLIDNNYLAASLPVVRRSRPEPAADRSRVAPK